MAAITVVFGLALIAVGVAGFVATGSEHFTALIPAGLGGVLALLGALSFKDALRKHTMHAAALVGVLGFAGCVMGVPKLITYLSGGEVARPAAAISQSVTALLCLVFVGLCVNSFVQARRRRARANTPTA
jgi:hypothetical protein